MGYGVLVWSEWCANTNQSGSILICDIPINLKSFSYTNSICLVHFTSSSTENSKMFTMRIICWILLFPCILWLDRQHACCLARDSRSTMALIYYQECEEILRVRAFRIVIDLQSYYVRIKTSTCGLEVLVSHSLHSLCITASGGNFTHTVKVNLALNCPFEVDQSIRRVPASMGFRRQRPSVSSGR